MLIQSPGDSGNPSFVSFRDSHFGMFTHTRQDLDFKQRRSKIESRNIELDKFEVNRSKSRPKKPSLTTIPTAGSLKNDGSLLTDGFESTPRVKSNKTNIDVPETPLSISRVIAEKLQSSHKRA